jgi:hypothetical protein
MDAINTLPDIKKAQKAAFNRCRVYLGVTFLSEISSANGTSLARDAWDGTRPRLIPLLWPHQPHVGPKTIATAFLTGARPRVSASTRDLALRTRNLALRQPLGCWLPTSAGFRLHWDCFVSAATRNIYRCQHSTSHFSVHTSQKTRHRPKNPIRGFSDETTVTCESLPPDAVPTEWSCEPNRLVIPATVSQLMVIPLAPKSPTCWADYVDGLPNTAQTHFVDRAQLLVELRTATLLLLASDGSAHSLQGSCGCLLATQETILLD